MIAAVYARKSTDQNLPDVEKSVTRQVEHRDGLRTAQGLGRQLSFAKTPSGGQVVDRSAPIMPRSGRSGRRSPCLHGVDPGDNSTASRQIPFPIRSPANRWPLGRTGDTARAAEATPISLADASRIPGPGLGLRISVGDPPPSL